MIVTSREKSMASMAEFARTGGSGPRRRGVLRDRGFTALDAYGPFRVAGAGRGHWLS